jgi:hypothetical protein
MRTFCIYVVKHVRARGYFSKAKGALEQGSLRNADLDCLVSCIVRLLVCARFEFFYCIGVTPGYPERTEHFEKFLIR